MLKSIAHAECRNMSELMRHWAKEPTAFNWVIGEFGMTMIEEAISEVCKAEMEDMFNENPIAMIDAMLSHMQDLMGEG